MTLIIMLQIQLWSGSSGIFQVNELSSIVAKEHDINVLLSERNQSLYDEVISLREDNAVVEGLARENLGLIKQGEVFYQLIPSKR